MPRMKSPRPVSLPFGGAFRGSVSLKRLAHLWNLPRREVRRLLQRGKLPFIEVAGRIRVPCEATDQVPHLD